MREGPQKKFFSTFDDFRDGLMGEFEGFVWYVRLIIMLIAITIRHYDLLKGMILGMVILGRLSIQSRPRST